jgi:Mg-chelatase subunit ChlD
MLGKIVGIRIVSTPDFREPAMISDRSEVATLGTVTNQFGNGNGKGMVYFLVDCSGSMAGHKMGQVKNGIMEFARDAIKKEYSVGLIKFDTSATRLCEPTSRIEDLMVQLDHMDAGGSTNMAAAIIMAYEHLANTVDTRVMVIATDGRPDRSQSALQAGQTAKNDGIDIIAIGTDDADAAFLKKLATEANLGRKVSSEQLSTAIASAYLLLPDPKRTLPGNLSGHKQGKVPQYSAF